MRILPRDEECEKRVLGTILSERDTIYEVISLLKIVSITIFTSRYTGLYWK